MKNKTIIILLVLVAFQSCKVVSNTVQSAPQQNYIYLDDVKEGIALERAQATNGKKFFDNMMSNEVKKNADNPPFEVVQVTSTDIYYGKLKESSDGKKIIVDPFYSTPYADIQPYFAGFESIDGANVKSKMFYYFFDRDIERNLKPVCPNSFNYTIDGVKTILTEKGILVEAELNARCYEKLAFTKTVEALLDPEYLDVIQEHVVMKNYAKSERTESGVKIESKPVLGKTGIMP